MSARIVSVNVGTPREVTWRGRVVQSAIWKAPVAGRVRVATDGLEGDAQVGSSHGGPELAVVAYALEDLRWWAERLGRPLEPGHFGENLTLEGLDLAAARVGDRLHAGSVVLEITRARVPCYKLGMRLDDPSFPDRFAEAGRPGVKLRVVREGDVGAGDTVRVEPAADGAARTVVADLRARMSGGD